MLPKVARQGSRVSVVSSTGSIANDNVDGFSTVKIFRLRSAAIANEKQHRQSGYRCSLENSNVRRHQLALPLFY
jgi:hypothetical protein